MQVIKNGLVAVLSLPLCRFITNCHGRATQAQLLGLHFAHPFDVVYLQYQQYY